MKPQKLSIILLMLFTALVISLPVASQEGESIEEPVKHRKEMAERIKASKIAFITEHVDLTPEEAEKFWPLYNEFEDQREEWTHNMMERFRDGDAHRAHKDDLTDEEAMEIMNKRLELEGKLYNLKMEYHHKYLKVLSPLKVLKLYEVEDRFRQHLIERLRHREGERKPEGRGIAPPHRGRMQHR